MKSAMKKTWTIVLAFVLVLAMATGCGNSNEGAGANESASTYRDAATVGEEAARTDRNRPRKAPGPEGATSWRWPGSRSTENGV